MKTWFVFLVCNEKIGTFANSYISAVENIKEEFGEESFEYLGEYNGYRKSDITPDRFIFRGMSLVDHIISSGALKVACKLA